MYFPLEVLLRKWSGLGRSFGRFFWVFIGLWLVLVLGSVFGDSIRKDFPE